MSRKNFSDFGGFCFRILGCFRQFAAYFWFYISFYRTTASSEQPQEIIPEPNDIRDFNTNSSPRLHNACAGSLRDNSKELVTFTKGGKTVS